MKSNCGFFYLACAFLFVMLMSSCGDIQQDLYLNKDGSGTLETSMDIGELLGMAKNFENVGSDQDTFSDDMISDTIMPAPAPPKDAMTLLMEKITDPAHDQDFDTMMSMISIMPDSIKQQNLRLDLVEKMFVRVKSPANSGDLTFGIIMKFDNTKHLREMIDYMETFSESNAMGSASPLPMDSETFMVFDADMKAGIITVDTVLYEGFAAQMGMSQDSAMSSEDLGMMEMMFGNSKIRSIVHVPGEVLSCTNQDAILTKDNKVIVEFPMMDVIRKGKIDGYSISFRP